MEEYERELARARWRLKKLREEVRTAKRKVEEAGERDVPLQDSIRQSYEEILQVPWSPETRTSNLCWSHSCRLIVLPFVQNSVG